MNRRVNWIAIGRMLLGGLVLNQQLGLTIVLAGHRLERVLAYCDRLIVMEWRCSADGPVKTPLLILPARPPLICRLPKR